MENLANVQTDQHYVQKKKTLKNMYINLYNN